jgi:hypothetical protein
LGVWISEATSLISQCLRKPGVVAQLMVDDLHPARLCITWLPDPLPAAEHGPCDPPRTTQSRVQLLVSRLDGVGLDVAGVPWTVPTPHKLLISDAVWPNLRAALKRPLPAAQCSTRDCLRAIEKLAAGGMWAAAQLSLGQGLWLPWRSLSCPSVTESEYNALLAELRVCPHLIQVGADFQSSLPLPGSDFT